MVNLHLLKRIETRTNKVDLVRIFRSVERRFGVKVCLVKNKQMFESF
jgi:acetolactate synthase regulatory subunit